MKSHIYYILTRLRDRSIENNPSYLHSESGVETVLMLMIIGFNLMQLYFFRCIRGFGEKKMLQIDIVEDVKDGLLLIGKKDEESTNK